MKVLTLFATFSEEQYRALMNKHKDETMIRIFLNTHLSAVVMKEVEAIKEEDFKSIELLAKETKL